MQYRATLHVHASGALLYSNLWWMAKIAAQQSHDWEFPKCGVDAKGPTIWLNWLCRCERKSVAHGPALVFVQWVLFLENTSPSLCLIQCFPCVCTSTVFICPTGLHMKTLSYTFQFLLRALLSVSRIGFESWKQLWLKPGSVCRLALTEISL